MNEYVDISGHIEFAESLIKKYEWDNDTKKNLDSQLQLIHNKQNDKCLNLSVVGESSTGKSSFINAFLGENLLVSSVIQGTTVVNTIIEYYTHPILYILKRDGSYDIINAQSIEDLRKDLSKVTTNPLSARNIKLVRVGIPSELLAKGIRIIDTPGTNSTESWHEDITKEALKDLSDLSIILTDAIHPLSQTLIDFVDENLADIYAQCVFVVTYYDQIKKSERSDTLHYIERKLAQEFGIQYPKVFPYIAPAIISNRAGEIIMPEQLEMVQISIHSQKQILELMRRNRHISQIKKMLALTQEAFDILQKNMESKKTLYAQEYRLLIKTKQTSLDSFIEAEKSRCILEFTNKANDIKDNLHSLLNKKTIAAKEAVIKSIMSYDGATAESIKSYISQDVPKECERQADIIVKSSIAANQSLSSSFSRIMKSYHRHFENQFNKLGIIKINLGSIKLTQPTVASVSLSNLKNSLDYMSTEVSKENWLMGGGMAVGATIGTAILPGVGTLVGGLVGLFVGAIGTVPSEELKKNACDKLSGQLDSVFCSVETDIISTYNTNVSAYEKAIIKEIEKYLKKYKTIVDREITKYDSLIKNNERHSMQISRDLKLILQRQSQLKSLSNSLNNK